MSSVALATVEPDDLLGLAAALVDIPSVSGDEVEIADAIESRLLELAGDLRIERVGDNVVARTADFHGTRVVLAGHLDTVPPNGNGRAVVDGDVLHGLGSADMKGGLAVMLALAEAVAQSSSSRFDVTFIFYESEEVAEERNGLRRLFRERPDLVDGNFAVLLEPTDGWLEAGCQGTLRLEAIFRGRRAHTARAWLGVNAIHRGAEALSRVAAAADEMRPVVVDGLTYREGLQVVGISGGVAGNVVPDECVVTVNRRFAPSISLDEAVAQTRQLLDGADEINLIDAANAALPSLRDPLVSKFVDTLALQVRPKLGWTDVARFAQRGIPAVNFGPGDTELSHTAEERVNRASLTACHSALLSFLSG